METVETEENEETMQTVLIEDLKKYRSLTQGGWVFFPHYKGDSNTIKLTTKRQILTQNNQFNDKTRVRR